MALFDQINDMNQSAWGGDQDGSESSNQEQQDDEESLQGDATASNELIRRELVLIQGGLLSSEDVLASLAGDTGGGGVDYDVFFIDRIEVL